MVCSPDFTITESNNPANIVLGKGESLIGEKCHRALRQTEKQCVDCPLNDTINSGTVIPLVKYDDRFGEYFEERCFPIMKESGELDSFVLFTKNVTKSRELEEKSARIKKLSALGQISSGVAHDFNNILTVVLGRVQLMKKLSADPHIIKSLEMIEKSALDGAAKVRKIQEFARPKDNTFNETIHLKQTIEEVLEITRPKWDTTAKIKGILIEPVIELEDDIYILGDPSDIRNALTNIIFNAIDAMPTGGVLLIKTRRIDKYIHIDIRDTGIGMTEETIERVFDPFFTTKGVLGNGLGMSEVYGIVKRHNGGISIKSDVGSGTTIKLRFPAAQPKEAAVPLESSSGTTTFSIYIIDDEEYIIETLKDFLTDLGHLVHSNSDPEKAMAEIRKQPYDIVITDLGMPNVNGLELADEIKKFNPDIQVILISGWALNLKESDLRNRIDFVINKPFSFEKITYTLSEVERKIVTSDRQSS
jgi:CheY-like chemotaxis protein/nitrogen-specific signal transduction histidine kinase